MTTETKDKQTGKANPLLEEDRILEVCKAYGISEPEEIDVVKRAFAIRQALSELEREKADAERKALKKERLEEDLIPIL